MNNLPSYQCFSYKRQSPIWEFCNDVFMGSDAWGDWSDGEYKPNDKARFYLPQRPGEDDDTWIERVQTSPWFDVYGQAIRDFCGLLVTGAPLRLGSNSLIRGFPIQLIDADERIISHWENLDLCGTRAAHFLFNVAVSAMKHGHTFILVDMPPKDAAIATYADYLTSGRRPYWVHLDATEIINWKFLKTTAGVPILERVTIKENHVLDDGDYGEKEVTLYKVLRRGSWELYAVDEEEEEPKVTLISYGETSLNYIPLVPIYTNKVKNFESIPPLRSLAELNVAHYRLWSDHLQKVHHCCLPTGVREGALMPGQMVSDEPLILGPHTFVDVPMGGDFRWAETNANSIAESRQEVHSMEQRMKMSSLAYLQEGGDRATAEEWRMRALDVEVSLKSFAVGLKSGLDQCLKVHADYMGITREKAGQVEVGTDLIPGRIIDSQALMAYTGLADRGFMSPSQLGQVLKEEGLLPPEMELSDRFHIKRETIYEVLAKVNPELLLKILRRDGVVTDDLLSK